MTISKAEGKRVSLLEGLKVFTPSKESAKTVHTGMFQWFVFRIQILLVRYERV